tara:strand:+ start:1651 stop:2394 length:744 start_codon:yes stop_codon:yes gene_type:complete
MMSDENIAKINEVIAHYFDSNKTVDWIPAAAIMPALVQAGVFNKDERKGLPLRKVLRKLDEASALDKIPTLHAERRSDTVYWYFVQEGKKYTPKEVISDITKKEQRILNIQNSDEYYLVNLCDELLEQKASRKHTFDTLVGNLHKKGKGRTKLPLDAYYKDLKLVIEFFEEQEEGKELDEAEQARMAQIQYYDKLKKKSILKKELRYLVIKYASFDCDEAGKLVRDTDKDKRILKGMLKDFIGKAAK